MPKKTKNESEPVRQLPPELIEQLFVAAGGKEGLTGPNGLLKQLTAALVNRALDAEMAEHLGYEKGEEPSEEQGNRRNGHREKSLRTDHGSIEIDVPRDRDGSFEPKLVAKHQRSFGGFDDKILSMYARGMSTRDIQRHLSEIYGVEISPDLVSRVTDSIVDELNSWQTRPLDALYPIVYLDALVLKIRDQGRVENQAVFIVVGVDTEGRKDVLGMWIERTEGAKFWSMILADLRQRGVQDILILCADGLTGLPVAVEAVFPKTIFQTCVVHLIRSSTKYVPHKDLKAVCAELKKLYNASGLDEAMNELTLLEDRWGKKYGYVTKAWRSRLDEWTPFLAFPPEVRRIIYTTNTIEALNRILRKSLKTRGALPTVQAGQKLIYLTVRNALAKWSGSSLHWRAARLQFAIHFGERFPLD